MWRYLVKKAKFYTQKWLNIENCSTEAKLYINDRTKNIAAKNLKSEYKNIVLGVGSSGPTTKWGIKNYIELANLKIRILIKK